MKPKTFNGTKSYLGRKKGYFFTVDGILSVSILVIGIFFLFFILTNKPIESPVYHLSEDVMNILSHTLVGNLSRADYPFIYSLIAEGIIQRPENSIIDQVGLFYYKNQKIYASALIQNITEKLIPPYNGFEFRIYDPDDGTNDPGTLLYHLDGKIDYGNASIIIPVKKIIFGKIGSTLSWGPYVVEATTWR